MNTKIIKESNINEDNDWNHIHYHENDVGLVIHEDGHVEFFGKDFPYNMEEGETLDDNVLALIGVIKQLDHFGFLCQPYGTYRNLKSNKNHSYH